MKNIKSLALVALTALSMPVMAQQAISFSYANPGAKLKNHGFTNPEIYDVCIKLDNPAFVGAKVENIKVPVVVNSEIENYIVWTSDNLNLESNGSYQTQFYPNKSMNEVTPENGYIDFAMTREVRVPEGGLYVGYSFKVTDKTQFESQYPILIENVDGVPNGLLVHTSETYNTWNDISETYRMVSPIEVTLVGDFQIAGAAPTNITNLFGLKNDRLRGSFDIINVGKTEITSIDYTVSLNDVKESKHLDLAKPLAATYGSSVTVDFDMACGGTAGTIPFVITVDKVNGENNVSTAKTLESNAMVCSYRPVHRPLFEEYTGTWCGGCVRGIAALEYIRETGYDKAVVISYHGYKDPMRIPGFTKRETTFPMAHIDRKVKCAPYDGTGIRQKDPGIIGDLDAAAEEFTPVDFMVSTEWADADQTAIKIDTKVLFVAAPEGKFNINYTLVEDGLQGPEDDLLWAQTNYDSKNPTLKGRPYLEQFTDYPGYIYGYVYNDVAVYNYGVNGIDGSLPSTIEIDKWYDHEFTINLDDCYSAYYMEVDNKKVSLIQNKETLRVAVQVMDVTDADNPVVLNSIMVPVGESASVDQLVSGEPVEEVWYDLSGRRVVAPANGIYVKAVRFSDGSVKSYKVAVKE